MKADVLDNLLNRSGKLAGVHVEPLDLQEPFVELAARFAPLPGTVVLLSGGDLDCSRYNLLGAMPWLSLSSHGPETHVAVDDRSERVMGHPFSVLRTITGYFRLAPEGMPSPVAAGLMGYLAYDLKDLLEELPRTSVDDLYLPDMLLFAPRLLVVHDKREDAARLIVPLRAKDKESPEALVRQFYETAASPIQRAGEFNAEGELESNFSRDEYQGAVQQVIDYITAGDVYQVNLAQRFRVPFSGDAFFLFRNLFARNPAPFFAFVQAGDHQIVSTSPERFLMQKGDRVEVRPIKGTRPRGETPEADRAMRDELLKSEKDGAELSMIVDLLRNDIGKVCSAGSVRVVDGKRLEAYENVYHLVAIVEGELDTEKNSVDLIEATFPGGSITGCPKVRSMEIIDELESCRRHVYCGSIGYIGFHDTMDLSIAIRTATVIDDTLLFSVGGGVVFDSRPEAEYEETLHKGRTLMAAFRPIGKGSERVMVWQNGRLRPSDKAVLPVDDQGLQYGYGFFETLRVDRGRVVLIKDHLARLDRTWRALMPGPPPDLTWESVLSQVVKANGLQRECAAVKILVTRGIRSRAPWDYGLIVSARPYNHRLKAIGKDGLGLGTYPYPRQTPLADHKTLNYLYYLLAGQWASDNGFNEALILNPDGSVSETNTANLLLINGREVVRPQSPAVLPGVMAQAVCRQLDTWGYRIIERPVRPFELLSAGQLLATNALMGAVPIVSVDGRTTSAETDLWMRINDALIPGW